MLSATTFAGLLALAGTASATISVTFPVAASNCAGGRSCGPFKWQIDDSVAPPGASFGETSVGIYTGSVNQQTLFLDLGTVADPTVQLEVPAQVIPAALGPNGDVYFLRFQSNDAVDPATGYPLQAFSAKFSLTGMTGQLSAQASAQINGQAVAVSSPARAATTARTSASGTGSGTEVSSTGTGTAKIGSNAKETNSVSASKNVTDTGAASIVTGNTVSLVAFLGAGVAYLAL